MGKITPKDYSVQISRNSQHNRLISDIRVLIASARQRVSVAVNAELTILYWRVGKRICSEILKQKRAEYGREIVQRCRNN